MRILKAIVFHFLMTFRGIIKLIFKILKWISLLGFFGFLLIGWSHEKDIAYFLILGTYGLMSLVFILADWHYDTLILKLKPNNIELILYD